MARRVVISRPLCADQAESFPFYNLPLWPGERADALLSGHHTLKSQQLDLPEFTRRIPWEAAVTS
jgi:hypothetical protein